MLCVYNSPWKNLKIDKVCLIVKEKTFCQNCGNEYKCALTKISIFRFTNRKLI